MLAITELKKHPVAILTYVIYLLLWMLFVAAMINISLKQAESGLIYETVK